MAHLFYPSHDIALANGVKHFNPPVAALRLQEDLASLADIWNQPFLRHDTAIPIPWGWDWDTRQYIQKSYGIKLKDLPSDFDLNQIRTLSSRQTTVILSEKLNELIPNAVSFAPRYLQNEQELLEFFREQDECGNRFVLKSPWSSSGRGLFPSHVLSRNGILSPVPREQLLRQGISVQKKMVGIMGEEWIENKVNDFAMLFQANGQKVSFIGYSLFDNDNAANGTTYRQGYLRSNEQIVQTLSQGEIQIEHLLHTIAPAYETILTDLLKPMLGKSWSLGFIGIDMLTYRDNNAPEKSLKIHPCVEMNLRCTMGVVCRLWYDQHLQEGLFRISPMQHDGHFKAEFLTTQ